MTTVARTLLDLAAVARRRTVERALEESERHPIFDLAAIDAVLVRHPRRPGAPLLRTVLAGYQDEHLRTRKELGRLFFGLCEDHGIALPQVNALVGPYEVDSLGGSPADRRMRRLEHACDPCRLRAGPGARRLAPAHGYRVVRFTWRRVVSEPGEVAGLLGGQLARAS